MTRKILVADDSVTIHKIVGLTFAGEDVAIEAVGNGTEAVEKTIATKPDVVLADVNMPGLNGYQVCEAIRKIPGLAATPVVLLVGSFEPFDQPEALRVGCDAHLTKPFDTTELIQIVESLMNRAPADQPPEATRSSAVFDLTSDRTKESFLGSNRILDVFGPLLQARKTEAAAGCSGNRSGADAVVTPVSDECGAPVPAAPEIPDQAPGADAPDASRRGEPELSEAALQAITEKVVHHMSHEVVREIAWEVVPELAEILIRKWLKENAPAAVAAAAAQRGEP